MASEFQEIAHSGGQITFKIKTEENGRKSYQTQYSSSRPVPAAVISIFASIQGIPIAVADFGYNQSPPIPNCFLVFVASDSEGKFGHTCPKCNKYWRSGPHPNLCPYCAIMASSQEFLSEAQKDYVKHYCKILGDALSRIDNGTEVINMDAVADATGKSGEKPSFYVSEKSQQNKFICTACGEFNDILGRFGYCSSCGTRNDYDDFEKITINDIRKNLNSNHKPENCVRDAIAAFDALLGNIAKQLAEFVPMTKNRKIRLTNKRFHNFKDNQDIFSNWFDINICLGMDKSECEFVDRMFHRRHVYEHHAGVVDKKYINDSGDDTVQLGQHIHEDKEDAHKLLGSLVKMARNLHNGFHDIFPPIPEPIEFFSKKKVRINAMQSHSS